VLERTGGNRSAAARALGLSRQGLLNKLRRYGIDEAHELAPLDGPGGPP
jgi:DNA-binding NtrC family response regulator